MYLFILLHILYITLYYFILLYITLYYCFLTLCAEYPSYIINMFLFIYLSYRIIFNIIIFNIIIFNIIIFNIIIFLNIILYHAAHRR